MAASWSQPRFAAAWRVGNPGFDARVPSGPRQRARHRLPRFSAYATVVLQAGSAGRVLDGRFPGAAPRAVPWTRPQRSDQARDRRSWPPPVPAPATARGRDLAFRHGGYLEHLGDLAEVTRREPVAATEHGERNLPRSGLAFEPAPAHPQHLRCLFGGVQRRRRRCWGHGGGAPVRLAGWRRSAAPAWRLAALRQGRPFVSSMVIGWLWAGGMAQPPERPAHQFAIV